MQHRPDLLKCECYELEGNLEVDPGGGAEEILEGGIERMRNGGKMCSLKGGR